MTIILSGGINGLRTCMIRRAACLTCVVVCVCVYLIIDGRVYRHRIDGRVQPCPRCNHLHE
jgi:hypothetical protein